MATFFCKRRRIFWIIYHKNTFENSIPIHWFSHSMILCIYFPSHGHVRVGCEMVWGLWHWHLNELRDSRVTFVTLIVWYDFIHSEGTVFPPNFLTNLCFLDMFNVFIMSFIFIRISFNNGHHLGYIRNILLYDYFHPFQTSISAYIKKQNCFHHP